MENKSLVFDAVYRMSVAVDNVILFDELDKLGEKLEDLGYTQEELKAIDSYIHSNVASEEYVNYMINKSILNYTEALADMKDLIVSQMEQGYVEMGNINLQIANENTKIIDNEGVNVNEVDRESAETGS